MCIEGCSELLPALRTIIKHFMLLVHQAADFAEESLGSKGFYGRVVKNCPLDEFRPVHHVSLECPEAASLAELGVCPASEEVCLEIGEDVLVRLCSADQAFHDVHCFSHVLAQAGNLDCRLVGSGIYPE